MNKIILSLAILTACTYSSAGSSSFPVLEGSGSVIAYAPTNRVVTYSAGRNNTTPDGQLLVCPYIYRAEWRQDACIDSAGLNQWQLLENSLPGFKPTAYEIRYTGNGYRLLNVYYSPK